MCGTPLSCWCLRFVRLHIAIAAAIVLVMTLTFEGCSRAPEINGTFDLSFVWHDGELQSTTIRPVERTSAPSALQKEHGRPGFTTCCDRMLPEW